MKQARFEKKCSRISTLAWISLLIWIPVAFLYADFKGDFAVDSTMICEDRPQFYHRLTGVLTQYDIVEGSHTIAIISNILILIQCSGTNKPSSKFMHQIELLTLMESCGQMMILGRFMINSYGFNDFILHSLGHVSCDLPIWIEGKSVKIFTNMILSFAGAVTHCILARKVAALYRSIERSEKRASRASGGTPTHRQARPDQSHRTPK